VFLDGYRDHRRLVGRPLHVLDVGCGEQAVLRFGIQESDLYYGMDVKSSIAAPLERYASLNLEEEDLDAAFPGQRFDVIFCGEVIEHVFSPDRLLRQLASVAQPDALIVISTPNLAYWLNRFMLLFGFNPFFVENSSEVVLGRRTKRLGQGNPTQGHVRLFTHRALVDLLEREDYVLQDVRPVSVWNVPGDRVLSRLSPNLGPNNVYFLRPPAQRAAT
jgi:SAM-dependent methyltransferase